MRRFLATGSELVHALRFSVFVVVLAALPAARAQVLEFEGILEPGSSDACQQDISHVVTPTCDSWGGYVYAGGADLSSLYCTYVRVQGFDVGIECPVLLLLSIESATAPCPLETRHLQVQLSTFTWVEWWRVPCAESYDVIRGDLAALTRSAGQVSLGQVKCHGDDLYYPNTFSSGRDTERPAAGTAFFYLSRAHGSRIGETSYGFSSSGEERVPAGGDCPRSP